MRAELFRPPFAWNSNDSELKAKVKPDEQADEMPGGSKETL